MDSRSKVGIPYHHTVSLPLAPVRASVRQAIHLRSALYRIGIAAQDRFPPSSRPSVRPTPLVRSSVRVRPWDVWNVMGEPTKPKADNNQA